MHGGLCRCMESTIGNLKRFIQTGKKTTVRPPRAVPRTVCWFLHLFSLRLAFLYHRYDYQLHRLIHWQN